MKTPVAFLIFNRPETTERVFAQIARARPAKLLVVADGPREDREHEVESCMAARAIIARVDWDCEVLTNYSDVNLGCKVRVSSGLDWVFRNVEAAIILEDDCVPHPSFFGFCESMLDRYRSDDRIMMINGSNFLAAERQSGRASYSYSRFFSIWGWASWRRAWSSYDVAIKQWRASVGVADLANVLPRRSTNISERLMSANILRFMAHRFDLVQGGTLDTWDYQWIFNCLFRGGHAIVPRTNLVQNVGVVGVHTEGRSALHYLDTNEMTATLDHPDTLMVDDEYDWGAYKMVAGGSPLVSMLRNQLAEASYLRWLYEPARKIYRATRNLWHQA